MITVILLALLSQTERPEWWRQTALGLKTDLSFDARPDGGICLDAVDAAKLDGLIGRIRIYEAEILPEDYARLWGYHVADLERWRSSDALFALKRSAIAEAEASERWPLWHVAIVGIGAALAGGAVGYLVAWTR